MKVMWAWLGLISGALPGMGVIVHGLGTFEPFKIPIGLMGAVCGPLAFGIHSYIAIKAKRTAQTRIASATIWWGLAALLAFALYWILMAQCVFQKEPAEAQSFIPLFLTGEGAQIVRDEGGRDQFYKKYGANGVNALNETQQFAVITSLVIFIFLFSVGSIGISVSIGLVQALEDARRIVRNPSKASD